MGKPRRETTIILYSASPQRQQLLSQLNLPIQIFPMNIDEDFTSNLSASVVTKALALKKLKAGLAHYPLGKQAWGIAADTLIEQSQQCMGKAKNRQEAREILSHLSGKEHSVYTSFALYRPYQKANPSLPSLIQSAVHRTRVVFRRLEPEEIQSYLQTEEWEGAAGAYRIQGCGARLVQKIHGLWSTVVGLPLSPLYERLIAMSYPFG